MTLYAVIRIRGMSGVHPEVERTLYLLRLRQKYAAAIYHSSLPGIWGMLKRVENWATFGEVDKPTLVELIRVRGRLLGDKPITDEWVKSSLGLSGVEELAEKLLAGEIHYHKLKSLGVKPFFRLHPPRGGFKGSIKRPYGDGGELGYRGSAINELIRRML
ncbi:MAG: 50S ribosomal protein L30 [Desulfurococcales archaeon]|nr:50S ribosomal protein L30 [Desulfurococcales archaeon]